MSDEDRGQVAGVSDARDFRKEGLDLLLEHRSGLLPYDIGEAVADVVSAIREAGKGNGSVTLTLTFRPAASGYVTVSDDIRVRKPKLAKPESMMFAHEDGHLTRNDPRQPTLPAFDGGN